MDTARGISGKEEGKERAPDEGKSVRGWIMELGEVVKGNKKPTSENGFQQTEGNESKGRNLKVSVCKIESLGRVETRSRCGKEQYTYTGNISLRRGKNPRKQRNVMLVY